MSEFRTMFTSFGKTLEIDPAAPFFDSDTGTLKILHKISVWKQENIETAITDEIIKTAKEHEVNDLIVLDKKAILDALQKQIPKKPIIKHHKEAIVPQRCGRLMEFLCPNCGKVVCAMYENDVACGGGIHKDLKGCSTCLQAIDFSGYYKKEGFAGIER